MNGPRITITYYDASGEPCNQHAAVSAVADAACCDWVYEGLGRDPRFLDAGIDVASARLAAHLNLRHGLTVDPAGLTVDREAAL